MKLIFPQATTAFNQLFTEMIESSVGKDFLDKSFDSYSMEAVSKVILVVLENTVVEDYLGKYLRASDLIEDFEIIVLKKETSGSICSTLMAISSLKGQAVIVSALDQIITGRKIDFCSMLNKDNADIIAPTYTSNDSSLCFTLKDDEGQVIQLFEKKPVSSEAILGVYLIRNFSYFYENSHELLIKYKGFQDRIFYTSDVINHCIGKGDKINFPHTDAKCYKIRSIGDVDYML